MAKEVLNDVDFPIVTELAGDEYIALVSPEGARAKITADDLAANAGSRMLYSSGEAQDNNATTGSPVLVHEFTVPAGTLTADGDSIHIRALFEIIASSSGTKVIGLSVAGTDRGGYTLATTSTAMVAVVEFNLIYRSPTVTLLDRWRQRANGALDGSIAAPADTGMLLATANIDWSSDVNIAALVQSNVADTVVCHSLRAELLKAPQP